MTCKLEADEVLVSDIHPIVANEVSRMEKVRLARETIIVHSRDGLGEKSPCCLFGNLHDMLENQPLIIRVIGDV